MPIVKYCHGAGVEVPEGVSPVMAGVDSEGMHLRINDRIVRIPFPATVDEPMAVRKTLVDMARVA